MIVRSRFVEIDGIRTHYLEAGEGRPVVLLHSGEFGSCAELSWELTMPKLAEKYRVIAPDWLGYGETDKLYDFGGGQTRMLKHMRRFMQVMELEKADVIGNSMGAGLTAKAIAADPDAWHIRSLVLIAGGGFNPDNEHRRAMMNYDCTKDGMKAVIRAMFADPKWEADEAYVQRRYELSLRHGTWECVAATRFKNPTIPPREFFGRADDTPYEKIPMPTLIIAGDEDKIRLPGWEKEIGDMIPDCEAYVINGTGHCPHIERPDAVNEIILDFLARITAEKTEIDVNSL